MKYCTVFILLLTTKLGECGLIGNIIDAKLKLINDFWNPGTSDQEYVEVTESPDEVTEPIYSEIEDINKPTEVAGQIEQTPVIQETTQPTLPIEQTERTPVIQETTQPPLPIEQTERTPVIQKTTQPPTEPPTEPPTQPPTEPPTQPPTEPPTQPPTEPPTQPPTQPPTEPPTQPPTEPPTQPPTEPPTQPPTEPPTQPPTEPPTQPPTQPPTEPPTQPPTEPPTQPPTEPPTQPPTTQGVPQTRPTGTPPTPTPCPANSLADIILVLDSSKSIGQDNWKKLQDFVSQLTKQFTIGPNDVRFAALTYSYSTVKLFDLKTYSDSAGMEKAFKAAKYLNAQTNTDKALNYIRKNNMFGTSVGGRPDAKDLVILITDGVSSSRARTVAEAQALKDEGAEVIAVGVGQEVSPEELYSVASSPDDVVLAYDYSTLEFIKKKIVESACKSKKSIAPTSSN